MDTIGLIAWASARKEMFQVEILPILRPISPKQFLYLFVIGQLKGFRYAWRASLSAHWTAGRRRLVARRLASIAWDVVCLRAGEIHLIRDHLRGSHERCRAAEDGPPDVAKWFAGQGVTWGDPRQMLDRAADARRRSAAWTDAGVPADLIAKAMRLVDRYDALAVGDPLAEDMGRVADGREDAAEFEIHTELARAEEEIKARRDLQGRVDRLNEDLARRPL